MISKDNLKEERDVIPEKSTKNNKQTTAINNASTKKDAAKAKNFTQKKKK